MGTERTLHIPGLSMFPTDRIGITGPNGAGKSTLMREIFSCLDLPAKRIVYLPQEIDAADSGRVLDTVRSLPNETLGRLMTIIDSLGSLPERLLDTDLPSPGEIRKLLLAEGILLQPSIIIMDEPTNHMDLPSIECVEKALVENNCTQLLVSHDRIFLNNVVDYFWIFEPAQDNGYTIRNI